LYSPPSSKRGQRPSSIQIRIKTVDFEHSRSFLGSQRPSSIQIRIKTIQEWSILRNDILESQRPSSIQIRIKTKSKSIGRPKAIRVSETIFHSNKD